METPDFPARKKRKMLQGRKLSLFHSIGLHIEYKENIYFVQEVSSAQGSYF